MIIIHKKILILLLLILPTAVSIAVPGSASYTSPASIISSAGGHSSSTNYNGTSSVGLTAVGNASSASYASISGTGIIVVASSSTAPAISNLKIDNVPAINGDYVKKTGTLTATISTEVGIDLSLSSIEVDGSFKTFSSLSGTSTYDATTGLLTYKLNFSTDGNHSIKISAVDVTSNKTTASLTVKVDTGSLKATAVYAYPNPYNPNNGNVKIAYQLNSDSDTSIYIFNIVGQLVCKQSIASGLEGAHAGYNEVSWTGKSDGGEIVGNDIYFLRIVSGGKPIGKTKIAVIK